ncbi:hypothetical protein BVI2075_530127 [Burkholderia vietnamiensis]|nr:hypothetical protein BVI2075_530127 [Burkholderia vietnamiensis]
MRVSVIHTRICQPVAQIAACGVRSVWANGVMENTPEREYLGGSIPPPPKGMSYSCPLAEPNARVFNGK